MLLTVQLTHTKVEQLTWLEAIWIPPLEWREGFTSNPPASKTENIQLQEPGQQLFGCGGGSWGITVLEDFYYGAAGSSARLALTSHFI